MELVLKGIGLILLFDVLFVGTLIVTSWRQERRRERQLERDPWQWH